MPIKVTRIRIHPGIGIARLGNSDEFFIGPEAPGVVVNPGGTGGPGPGGGTYRDSEFKLKRQAQRFRIYGYDAQGNVVAELNADSPEIASINWRVHVRNMKAANYAFQGVYLFNPKKYRNPSIQGNAMHPIDRDRLIIDPGPQTIGPNTQHPIVMAGDVFTGITEGTLPGYLRYCGFTPEDPSKPGGIPGTVYPLAEFWGQLALLLILSAFAADVYSQYQFALLYFSY